MGSGGLALSHDFLDIEKDFRVGDELDTFKDVNELVDKCKHWISSDNKDERQRIASNAYHSSHNKFTWGCRAQELLELYLKHK